MEEEEEEEGGVVFLCGWCCLSERRRESQGNVEPMGWEVRYCVGGVCPVFIFGPVNYPSPPSSLTEGAHSAHLRV